MGRNEIRLRRQKMSSGRIAQHRNYGALMDRHERDIKLRRIARAFLYFLIIAFLLILFLVVKRWEQKQNNVKHDSAFVTKSIGLLIPRTATQCLNRLVSTSMEIPPKVNSLFRGKVNSQS